ncbi:hypothetical protein LP416_10715 [Polaromonas sp. P2-4]|nr:hypothetical protein LP416_10715 [Polaromonas sp. P2-4]
MIAAMSLIWHPYRSEDDFSILVLGVLILTLLALLFWPWASRLIDSLWAPAEKEYLGTVQKITYVGGLGNHTQIDMETRTLLLRGPVIINKGARLELRKGVLDSQVCDIDTGVCRDLIGQ